MILGEKLLNIKYVFSGCTLKMGTESVPTKLEKFYTFDIHGSMHRSTTQ